MEGGSFFRFGLSPGRKSMKKSLNVNVSHAIHIDEPRCVNVFHETVIFCLDSHESRERLIYIIQLNNDCA